MEPGESWAYRARSVDPVVEVRVVRVGTQKPARVLVRFVDEEFEGKEDWVPPARLKVLWEHVDAFRAREARWDALTELGLPRDDPREYAAEHVFINHIDSAHAFFGYFNDGCAIHLVDPGALARALGLDVVELTGHPAAFVEDGVLIAPWPVTEVVVTAAARKNAEAILNHVDAEERQAQHDAIHGRYSRSGRGRDAYYFDPETSREMDLGFSRPIRDVLRGWCGHDADERFDELIELRKEIRRVGDIAQQAIDLLDRSGVGSEAVRLRRELGTPVEMLRTTDQDPTR
jgi:hypothetical protein